MKVTASVTFLAIILTQDFFCSCTILFVSNVVYFQVIWSDHGQEHKDLIWREAKPNSNDSNIPLLLWRGDENNQATLALAFGLYDQEFKKLQHEKNLKVLVEKSDTENLLETVIVNLDLPKDDKLARKAHGQAGSGSDFLCTYCDASRKSVSKPPYSGDKEVTLTSTLLSEAARYCNLNPGKKSQADVVKHSFGMKETPITSTEPSQETPDPLHLDINVSQHLITIGSRIYHFGSEENPTFQYEKTELHKKAIERSEAKYFSILREKITTLPELTQFPGNFAREFCALENAQFISDPLPKCPAKLIWVRLMQLWRCMRQIHKSNTDPSLQAIEMFKVMVIEFQEKLYSFLWVPPANQVHRLSHLAFFMQSRELSSIGAFSLEGLEHGNFSTKLFESTRVWKGNSKEGNKQLFRILRLKGSPTLKRAAKILEGKKRKPDKCSRCGQTGHKKNMTMCPLFNEMEEYTESEEDDQTISEEDDGSQTEVTSADESQIDDSNEDSGEDSKEEDLEEEDQGAEEVDEDVGENIDDGGHEDLSIEDSVRSRADQNERLIRENREECIIS